MHKKRFFIKILVGVAILALLLFLYGFISKVGIGHPVLFGLLTTALVFKILKSLFEWYHYFGLKPRELGEPKYENFDFKTVDIFTTACPGEPYEMFEETLKAMVAVTYPHKNYLCDEGNDPALKKLCKELGVIHVTRSTHENAKAGNINNALAQSTSEFCVILDPDHVPYPDFLDHVLHPFEDPEVGYVQIVQAYSNQAETFVARAAAEQTYMFYGPLMEAMSDYGTAQAIGANCTFRRAALDSIGGHAPGLTEDMHTSMLLHAKKWKPKYLPMVLSRGLVPSSISAYYKQQLKWGRGTFDLWFNLFPKLIKNFSWRQFIHYGLMPVYYLFGLITLIDIAVPVVSLMTGEYPWLLDPLIFFAYFIPFLVLSLVVRLSAQNWLHDPHEQGVHIFGGILRVGTWWVYIVGLVYTILNIKVPYIPTPKKYTSKNEFLLGLPNLLVSILSLSAAVYGLNQDWQPYSLLMGCFAISNSIIFFSAFAIGQTRWVFAIRNLWKNWKSSKYIESYEISYHKFNKIAAPVLILLMIGIGVLLSPFKFSSEEERELLSLNKEYGGFYLGIDLSNEINGSESNLEGNTKLSEALNWSVIGTELQWGSEKLPISTWQNIIQKGAFPLINWEPYSNRFDEFIDHPELGQNQKIFQYIQRGYFDEYIDKVALALRETGHPIFLNFAPEMDNPKNPWSKSGENTSSDFIMAWRYIYERFESLGIQNITWVWSPSDPEGLEAYFPGGEQYPESRYVDWIGLSCKQESFAEEEDFTVLYQPFKNKLDSLEIRLPIILTEMKNLSNERMAKKWTANSIQKILANYPEIKSVLIDTDLYNSFEDIKFVNNELGFFSWIKEKTTLSQFEESLYVPVQSEISKKSLEKKDRSHVINGTYGGFNLKVDGEGFYIKGVCYSAGDEWREGYLPLSMKQLRHDFQQIKDMGANTIRRYEPSIYDRNIFNAAEEYELKVMYGFWFDPKVDYFKNQDALEAYESKVLHYVNKYKDERCIVAWNIGNETWGLLKKTFEKPYLTLNRKAYLEFLENLSRKIHEIDDTRPIFSTEEHEHYQISSTVYEMSTHAPSLDVVGINSYYEENIKDLNNAIAKFDTLRPYVVTEFGAKGYWSPQFGDYWNDSLLLERTDISKAQWLVRQWEEYIEPNRGFNLGGIAFSWRDRYEGTATWFGMTDYKGRLKPLYHYLQNIWTGSKLEEFPELSIVGHWYPLQPGQKIWLTAAVTNNYEGKLTYEWEVIENEKWEIVTNVTNNINENQIVELEMPKKKSKYRVYVYAIDTLGNVVSNSRALLQR